MESVPAPQRTLPHNADAEKSVLGSMLISQEAVEAALERLRSEDFYLPRHQDIFSAMLALSMRGDAVDTVTLVEALDRSGTLQGAGGVSYISELALYTPTAANVAQYIVIVEERSIMRQLIKAGGGVINDAMSAEKPMEQMLNDAELAIYNISMQKSQDSLVHVRQTVVESYQRIGELMKHRGMLTGVTTGFTDLDRYTSGLQKSDLVIIAGRPSMGKTAFALDIALNAAKAGSTVCIFSLEMSREQLVRRMLCAESGIDMQSVSTGRLSDAELMRLAEALPVVSDTNIYIDDNASMGVAGIRSKARRLQSREGLDLIIIDYLQLMQTSGKSDNRVGEISEITRTLKLLARELSIPIVLLSQLSRGPETRNDHRPIMADLRESGAIEQDADIIMMLYRPAVYGESEDNDTEVILAKHRNGPTGVVHLTWIANCAKFVDGTGREY